MSDNQPSDPNVTVVGDAAAAAVSSTAPVTPPVVTVTADAAVSPAPAPTPVPETVAFSNDPDEVLGAPAVTEEIPEIDDTTENAVANQTPATPTPTVEAPAPVAPAATPAAAPNLSVADGEETMAVTPPQIQQKVTQELPYIVPNAPLDPDGETVALPSNFPDQVSSKFENAKNQNYADNPEGRRWWNLIEASFRGGQYNNVYKNTVENQEADFHQFVDYNNSRLMAGSPRFKQISGETLKGEKAVLRLQRQAGIGMPWQIPLWHSGFWLTLKSPSDTDLINLNYLITSDKIDIGRWTYGLSHSNMLSYTVSRLMKFALDHLYDCSLDTKNIPESGLLSLIHQQDIQSVVLAIVATMYPYGYQFERPCVNNPETCNHIEHELINLKGLQYTDMNALSDWQRHHMSKRGSGSMTLEEVRRYQDELKQNQSRTFKLTEGDNNGNDPIKITLRCPTVAEHIDAGFRWISEITEAMERTIQEDADTKDRNGLVNQMAQATVMRQYTHMVASIDPGNNNIIDDPETIEKALSSFSNTSSIREKFITEVIDFIEKSTFSIIGIPAYNCPKCGAPQDFDKALKSHVNIIPLDLINIFFNLFGQRISRISQR